MASVLQQDSCQLCSKTYNVPSYIPRVLQCLDVFCQPCLERLHDENGSDLVCPTCKEITKLRKDGVQSLPQDHAVLQAKRLLSVQGQGNEIPCHECPDDSSATFFCKDCGEYQCQTCRNLHLDKRSKMTRSHSVIKLQDVTQDVIKSTLKPSKCKEHDQPLRFYCDKEECKLPICVECTVFEHEKQGGHKIRKLNEVFQSSKDKINTLTEKAKEEYTLLVKREENERKCKLMMEREKGKVLNEIQGEFDRLTGIIKERKRKLEEEVERRYGSVSDEIQSRLGNIKKEKEKRLRAQTFAEAALDHCTDVDFLTIDKTVKNRFDTLTQSFQRTQPIRGYKLGYTNKLSGEIVQTLSTTENCVVLDTEIISSVEMKTMSAVQNQRSNVANIFFKDKDGNRLVVDLEGVKVTASVNKEEPIKCEVEVEEKLYQVYLTAGSPGKYLISVEIHSQKFEDQYYFVQVHDEKEYEEELAASEECYIQEDNEMTTRKDTTIRYAAQINATGLDGSSMDEPIRSVKPSSVESCTLEHDEMTSSKDTNIRYAAQINATGLAGSSKDQPMGSLKSSCPAFTIDKDTVHGSIQVSNDGKMLSHPPDIQRGKRQLKTYAGGKGTRCFNSSTTGKIQYRIRVEYKIFQQLEGTLLVFEIGLSTDECINKNFCVAYQPNANSFLAASCTEHSSVCCRLVSSGEELFHSRLSDNTVGTEVVVTYNFFLDTKEKTWTVKDNDNKAICVANSVSLGQDLWPVFGLSSPTCFVTTLQLLSTEGLSVTIDKDTVHRQIHVSDDGRTLSRVGSILRGDRQLKRYKGGRGTISFTGTMDQSAYFQVRLGYRIKQQLAESNLVFEVGLCRQEHIDKSYYVGKQPHAISFCSSNCEDHTGNACMFVEKAGSNVFHKCLSSNTVETEVAMTYGFLMDVEKRTWTVVDCGNNVVLYVVKDVNLDQPLWPVFGIPNPYRTDVTMTLLTGDSIQNMPSCISI